MPVVCILNRFTPLRDHIISSSSTHLSVLNTKILDDDGGGNAHGDEEEGGWGCDLTLGAGLTPKGKYSVL